MPTYLNGSVEDPRDLVGKLRRRELEAILLDNNISYPKDPPAELSRTMVRSAGINVGKYIDEVGNFLWPESWKNREGLTNPQPAPRQPTTAIGNMKRPDLIKYCKEEGIEWSIRDSKKVLEKKVQEHLGIGNG